MIRKFYLASPFFTPSQIVLVGKIEVIIRAAGFELYSPRESGIILKDMKTQEERDAVSDQVLRTNTDAIDVSDAVFAVIDDRDLGTVWEMGYGYAASKKLYTYTDRDYGLNVMIAACVSGHARGIDQAQKMLQLIREGKSTDEFRAYAAT